MVAKAAGNTNTNMFSFGDIAWDSWGGGGGGGGGGGWSAGWGTSSWNTGSSLSNTGMDTWGANTSFGNHAGGLFCAAPQTSDYAAPGDYFNSDPLVTTNGFDFNSVTGNRPDTASTFTSRNSGQTGGLPVTDLPGVTVTANSKAPEQAGKTTASPLSSGVSKNSADLPPPLIPPDPKINYEIKEIKPPITKLPPSKPILQKIDGWLSNRLVKTLTKGFGKINTLDKFSVNPTGAFLFLMLHSRPTGGCDDNGHCADETMWRTRTDKNHVEK